MSTILNFDDITEAVGDEVTAEQIQRIQSRYRWAADYCAGKDTIEIACGTGQGLGLLARRARKIIGADINSSWIKIARAHYGHRIPFSVLDITKLPIASQSFDVVVFFETLYFIDNQQAALLECRRILRKGGTLLLALANPDAPDFHPYRYASHYHNVPGLHSDLKKAGFESVFFGNTPVGGNDVSSAILRRIKRVVVKFNLVPASKALKRNIKRLVYGRLATMPSELTDTVANVAPPVGIANDRPNYDYRIYFCAATAV